MTEVTVAPWPSSAQRLRIGEIEIDLRYRIVHRAGMAHELNPRCFDLLLLFLREPHVLQTRDAIFRKIWPGVVVEDANLTNNIWMLRRALGGIAKQWLRTVSKQGYIFDPPTFIQLAVCPPEQTAASSADDQDDQVEPAIPPVAPPCTHEDSAPVERSTEVPANVTQTLIRGWSVALALAASIAVAIMAGVMLRAGESSTALARIVLVATPDSTLADEARWPSKLLHAWVDWQLRASPDVMVANTIDDAGNSGGELAVLLSVDMPAQRDGEWQVSARFRGASPPTDITRRSTAERLVTTIDQVSRDVLAALVPAVSVVERPVLQLDAGVAVPLIEGLAAEQRCRWGDAVRAYNVVVEKAPSFGFARVRLAQSLAEMGQQGAAQIELARAQGWINALPESLRRPIQAQELVIRQEYIAAAAAFAALQKTRGGESEAYRLAEAGSLRRAGRSRDAVERLAGALPTAPAQAVRWLIERAEAEVANRDLARASVTAADAIELASKLGWEHERAQAMLLLAEAQSGSGQPVDATVFEQAAQGFEIAGDRLSAMRARVYAGLSRADSPHGYLDPLLAEARSAGNAAVEIDALRRTALSHYRAGDTRLARERFAQAAAVAESAGDLHQRRLIDLDLLREDTLRLDFTALDRRIAMLRSEPLQGGMAYAVGLNAARLHYLRGRFDDALTTLKQTEDALREADSGNLPQIAAGVRCIRAAVRVVQGQTAAARNDFRDCRATGLPVLNHFADVGDVELAIQTGDLPEARRLLAPMRDMLAAQKVQPDRWNLVIEVAPLLARVGELDAASRMLDEVLPAITQSGYRLIEANAHTTRAEIALAQGKADEAETEAAISEAMLPPDYWYERRRLRTVGALVAQARGQTEQAARAFEALHADARARGDVLGELLVHSLMDANIAVIGCPDEQRARLLAQSGMRGASDIWMNPAARDLRAALTTTPL